ncbi:hypothetical protein HK100_006853 [Physocladia obscura]|uniref:Chitin-binding type-3 domain-containing protein n=1 Tax=Physocladia obscura TaxID=109957 RepID=A0AAD5TA76_9FUNG|nr:hypothetical protein HK100_006853 [Physocladia obscura]
MSFAVSATDKDSATLSLLDKKLVPTDVNAKIGYHRKAVTVTLVVLFSLAVCGISAVLVVRSMSKASNTLVSNVTIFNSKNFAVPNFVECYATYDPALSYPGGSKVSYDNVNWISSWWEGPEYAPGGANADGGWYSQGSCISSASAVSSCFTNYDSSLSYPGGSKVSYNNANWIGSWWENPGYAPGGDNSDGGWVSQAVPSSATSRAKTATTTSTILTTIAAPVPQPQSPVDSFAPKSTTTSLGNSGLYTVSWNWFYGPTCDCDCSITTSQFNTGYYAGAETIDGVVPCGKTGTFTYNGVSVTVTYAWQTTGGSSYHELSPQAFADLIGKSSVKASDYTTAQTYAVAINDPGRIYAVACAGTC